MSRKVILRVISSLMFIIAAGMVICASIYPEADMVIHIGSCVFTLDQLRSSYAAHAVYIIIMIVLFAASFFAEEGKINKEDTFE